MSPSTASKIMVSTFFTLFTSMHAQAIRSTVVVPTETASHDYQRGACGIRGSSYLRCKNLSTFKQTVTLNLKYQTIWHRAFLVNATGISGWKWFTTPPPPTSTGGFLAYETTLPGESVGFSLNDHESKEVPFGMTCDMHASGLTCKSDPNARDAETTSDFHFVGPENTDYSLSNRDTGSMMRYKYEASITVQEDRGAILCTIYSEPIVGCGFTQVTNTESIQLNGGRAF